MIAAHDMLSLIGVSAEYLETYALHILRLIRTAGWKEFSLPTFAEPGAEEVLLADRQIALVCLGLKPEAINSQRKLLYSEICCELNETGAVADEEFELFAKVRKALSPLYRLYRCCNAAEQYTPAGTLSPFQRRCWYPGEFLPD